MSKEIVIDIDADGTVRIEAMNFEGKECEAVTAGIEAALGEVVTTEKKPEYWRRTTIAKPQQRAR